MTVTTKFNKGDVVWYMLNNKPLERKIVGIRIHPKFYDNDVDIYYTFNSTDQRGVSEEKLFKTKQELINNL